MTYEAYTKSARFYDLIYSFKDYAAEVDSLAQLLAREVPGAREVLDVACGTAEHARLLAGRACPADPSTHYRVDGVDLDPAFARIAQEKCPSGRFEIADMANFDLGRRYDAVLCLFSAIGYLLERERLVAALTCFRRHLRPGGLVIVEPWFTPEAWRTGSVFMQTASSEEFKVCRMCVSAREGDVAITPFQYMVASAAGVECFAEEHRLALRTVDEMLQAFRDAGLTAELDPKGLTGRGLYLARASAATA